MSPGSTTTGAILEQIVVPVLDGNHYSFVLQKVIGQSVSGRKHRVDVLVELDPEHQLPISMKWQQVSGTAEEKVPYEVIKLLHAIQQSQGRFPYAYLVLGGDGWSALKEFYLGGGLRSYIAQADQVRIVTLEGFITRANRRIL